VTGILTLAIIVLGVLLLDTRRRLNLLERWARTMRETAVAAQPELPIWEPVPAPEPVREQATAPVFAPEVEPQVEELQEPEPTAEPLPRPDPEAVRPAAAKKPSFGFEDLFGRKLPIWAGGLTLIVAAVLMVKYSIDSGLLSPAVRVVLGLLFGAGMIGLAELARRREAFVRDPRVAQALAGAGVGALYAATLAAANLYGLVGPGLAFAGLTAITGLALGLTLRFGAPCAVLGLVGGLATPALVQSQNPSVPLLAGYLAVVIGAITILSRRQRWVWLGVSALVGGAGWSLFVIATGGLDTAATLSVGLLVVLLALGLPASTLEGRAAPLLRGVTAVVGALQLAILVDQGDYAPLTWGLYGLLSLAYVWLAARTPVLRRSVAVPLLTALGLAAAWPRPELPLFGAVMAGIVLIYGAYALRQLWREHGGLGEAGLLGTLGLGGYTVCFGTFYEGAAGQDVRFASLSLLFAAVPALGAALGWSKTVRRADARFALLAGCSGVLVILAGLVALPEWSAPAVVAAVAVALLALAGLARDPRLSQGALGFLVATVLALVVSEDSSAELTRFAVAEPLAHPGRAVVRWSAVLIAAAAFAWRHAGKPQRLALQPLAVLLGYGVAAQVVPAPWLAVASAAALLLLGEAELRKPALRLVPAQGTLAVVLVLWAVEPLGQWLLAATMSLAGDPVLVADLPEPGMALRRLVLPSLAAALVLWRHRARWPASVVTTGALLAGGMGVLSAHVLYKPVFRIADAAAFISYGLAERCLWEGLLLAAGLAVWRFLGQRRVALALIAAALAHNVLYTLVLHDPLWAEQAVGTWPLVNLLLPAFGLVFAALTVAGRIAPAAMAKLQRPVDGLRMATILLFAFATLRQLFAGNILVHGAIGEVENILQSVLAIALAIGFLVWGIRQGSRDWRIASLALMLVAVGKVFLFDASGLEGLLRIASFLALGFSLIGIGWLYSRYLKPGVPQ
jgi:uncharacterized membrane protein